MKGTGSSVNGPRGKVRGASAIQECLLDGTLEDKQFAPRYGEFRAEVTTKHERYDLAVAVPLDSLPGPVPNDLAGLRTGAAEVFDAVPSGRWKQVAGAVKAIDRQWDRLQDRPLPRHLRRRVSGALRRLERAVEARDAVGARQAAIDVGHAGLDLELWHRVQGAVDRDRIGLREDQVALDWEVGDAGAVAGDGIVIRAIGDRIR